MAVIGANGKWHFRVMVDGKRYRRSTGLAATARNKTIAEDQERAFRRRILEGRLEPVRIRARLFSDAAAEFLAWADEHHRGKPRTALRLRTSFASLQRFFAQTPVLHLSEGAIEDYKTWRMKEHKVRDITLRHDLHALSVFFQYAVRKRWARRNPTMNVEKPSARDAVRQHVVTGEELAKYLAAASPNLRDLATLLVHTGLRPGEALALRLDDVDLDARRLRVREGKTRAAKRTIPLHPEALRLLAWRIATSNERQSPWVFPSQRLPGQHIQNFEEAHERALQRSGVRFVLYDLRHTWATRMAALGTPLKTLAELLGHASLNTISRYVHPGDEEKADWVARLAGLTTEPEITRKPS